ncbi:REP element-mobilizing transposase RayT [Pedobacter suwonensis]|uniref:REP element-mobilizing transposase RayT n=1 Tax=Pedobacter suwonensis TaxID=332999 RepID=A0A1I0TYK4_9SPHI|nr:transposase [Pedobacter suwonensis]SFA56828.1 REP element-mobilizing transposase RayT [Pedobacter suwonensis]
MSDQYQARDPEGTYFLTFTIVDWVDIFTRISYKEIIINSLKYCQSNKGLKLYAYCLMTNHIHLIASASSGIKLFEIIRDFKKFTNKAIITEINSGNESRKKWLLNKFEFAGRYFTRIENYKVWQDGYHAVELISPEFTFQKLNYIHQNPVTAGIVSEPENYIYSSATNYHGLRGLIEIELLDID